VAAGFDKKRFKLWDVDSGDLVHEDLGETRFWALSATFSPNSQQLAVGSMGVVHVWDLAPPYPETEITHERSNVRCVAISPNGQLLAIAGDESVIRLHDLVENRQRMLLSGHLAPIRAGTFSPDGRLFASASNDRTVRLWKVATGEPIAVLRGHTDNVISVAFSADGKTLASGSVDQTVILWDVTQPTPGRFQLHESPIQDLSISVDGKILATTSYLGHPSLALWDMETGRATTLLESGHPAQVVAFSPVDNQTLVAGVGGNLQVWNLRTREFHDVATHKTEVVALAFSPDGKRLASAARGTVNIWDTKTWTQTKELDGPSWIHTDVVFSLNNALLATPVASGKATLYDTSTWKLLATFSHHREVTDVAFSPKGNRLATVSHDGTIGIWDVTTGEKQFDLMGETSGLYCVAFSPDGNSLVTGGVDSRLNIWKLNMKKPELVASLRGHRSSIRCVEFTRDGKTLVTASKDGTVRLWHAASEDEIAATDAVRSEESRSD
jgi:WD40 repeat protein